jgi:archaeosortase A (PGF-CTERM-specific)
VTVKSNTGLPILLATFGLPTIALMLGYLFFRGVHDDSDTFMYLTSLLLFLGLGIIGIGYWRGHHKNLMVGWGIFSSYWATQPGYFLEIHDLVNAVFCILGVYFLFYIAYHEYISHLRHEEISSLRFLAGTTFIAGFFYFLIEKIPVFSGFIIKMVADQTALFMRVLGLDVAAGSIIYTGEVHVPITFDGTTSVFLILACTGIQSIMIFIGAIAAVTHADSLRRWKAFLVTVPVIYLLNIIRNMGVIYGIEVLDYSFEFMHHVVGKIGSLLALIILAFCAFSLLPELFDNIMGLADLPKRKGPLENMFRKQ